MSIKHYKHVWANCPEVKGSHKLVLLALAEFANDDSDECWPSIARLSDMTGLKDRQVQNLLRDLKTDGYIEIETNYGRKNTNVYKLIMTEKVQSIAPLGEEEKVQSSVEKVQSSTEKVQSSDIKGAADCTRSVIEPIRNKNIPVAQPSLIAQESVSKPETIPKQPAVVPVGKKDGKESTAYKNPETGVTTEDIFSAWKIALDHAEPEAVVSYGKEMKAAKQLAQAGKRPSDITTCFWKMKRENKFYKTTHLSLMTIATNIAAVMTNGKVSIPVNVNQNVDTPRKRMKEL